MSQGEPKEAVPRSRALAGLVAALVVAMSLSALITFSRAPAKGTVGSGIPARTASRLASAVMQIARVNGDPRPSSVMVVRTTRGQALRVATPGDTLRQDTGRPVYLVVMRGTFTAVTTRPPGTPAPTGSYLAVTLDPTTFRVLDLGLSKHRPDVPLRSFGRVTSLTSVRLPRLAEHPVDQHRASRPRAHEHHVRQHHARPHHLGAIRKSRAHRRHAGVIVTRHHQIRPRPVRHPVRQPVVIVPRHRRPVTVPKPRPVLS